VGPPTSSSLPRTITLPHGRSLVVRRSEPGDAEALQQLYEGLSLDDRYHRFFSGSMPRGFAERWATLGERGGVGIVAVTANGEEHVVAEAGFGVLADGDGEFAITVSREWRGWLGAYLLDILVEEAARRGVGNLRAEILVENTAMLALVRSRGYAVLDDDDWSCVRVTIATTGSVPDWPAADDRPRVLVEAPGGHWSLTSDADTRGLQVIACPGPDRSSSGGCPALDGHPCPLAAHADVIVFALPPSDPHAHALLAAHPRLHGDVPLIVAPPATGAASVAADGTTPSACTPAAAVIGLVSALAARHHEGTV
jgi:hypothetical protein